jgi:hypothetical protein
VTEPRLPALRARFERERRDHERWRDAVAQLDPLDVVRLFVSMLVDAERDLAALELPPDPLDALEQVVQAVRHFEIAIENTGRHVDLYVADAAHHAALTTALSRVARELEVWACSPAPIGDALALQPLHEAVQAVAEQARASPARS